MPARPEPSPTVFHLTHPKAGSQWVRRILTECWPERVVTPDGVQSQFFYRPLVTGGVYPAVYATCGQFEGRPVPPGSRRFVVIRDLRDTLISAYFSLKVSHSTIYPDVLTWRSELLSLSQEAGLLRLLEGWLPYCAAIQASWIRAGVELIRYEDLLEDDLGIFGRVLGESGLPIDTERFREVVLAARFERLTHGRPRGQEDPCAHERKGVIGDWRNHFSGRMSRQFNECYGELHAAAGYGRERDERRRVRGSPAASPTIQLS